MEIEEKHKKALQILNTNDSISKYNLEQLVETCCKSLANQEPSQKFTSHGNTFALIQLQTSLLYILTQFVRHSETPEDLLSYLTTDCSIEQEKAKLLENYYGLWYDRMRLQFINIGTHLPHVTDVRWEVGHLVKSNSLDQPDGPLFKLSLKIEKYDAVLEELKHEFIEFTCTSQELQDLVYKLKDIVRHCQKLASGLSSN
ncbi:COMM domain-containing protein 3 isoform X2 [Dendroctonus ponderosae]